MNDKLNSNAQRRALLAARRRYGIDDFLPPGRPAPQTSRPASQADRSVYRTGRPLSLPKLPKRKRSWVHRTLTVLFLVAAVGGGIFGYRIIAAGDNISTADRSILGQ